MPSLILKFFEGLFTVDPIDEARRTPDAEA